MFKVIPLRGSSKSLIRFTINTLNQTVPKANAHAVSASGHGSVVPRNEAYPRIGNREIVGFGKTGEADYYDDVVSPLPALRWLEDTPELKKLREKAKGDWASLTNEEWKSLYRADFRQTFAEYTAPTGEWKFTLGMLLLLIGGGIWLYYFVATNIYTLPKSDVHSHEHQARMLERMIAQGSGKITGVSAEWDYEKGDWKKNVKK